MTMRERDKDKKKDLKAVVWKQIGEKKDVADFLRGRTTYVVAR